MEKEIDQRIIEKVAKIRSLIMVELGKVIVGQEETIELLLTGLLAKGHCLFVGVPGLAKTTLVNTLARALDLDFNRIQFTPDLMPADITGTDILEEDKLTKERIFRFVKGPLFTNLLLADEVNRTSPKTQSALLQAMQEYKVTAAGQTYDLTPPFMVYATQNPIEQEGTYPLPEAQLDRFMMHIDVSYPTFDEEVRIGISTTIARTEEIRKIISHQDLLELQNFVYKVPVSDYVMKYAVKLVRATRPKQGDSIDLVDRYVSWGAGPRALQHMILAAKAFCLLDGRYCVTCKDIRTLARPVLKHRVLLNFHAESQHITSTNIIEHLTERFCDEVAETASLAEM